MIVAVEAGSRRAFASALEWPGWCRSGRDPDGAVEALLGYRERYRPVVERAGLAFLRELDEPELLERAAGNATTDFGAPGIRFAWDDVAPSPAEAERAGGLLEAAWACFDGVVASSPQLLRKGPRGGGRDRDAIVAHVLGADAAYRRKLGLAGAAPASLSDPEALRQRAETIATLSAGGARRPADAGGWPLRYAARRMAWHVLDHLWEMEDRREVG